MRKITIKKMVGSWTLVSFLEWILQTKTDVLEGTEFVAFSKPVWIFSAIRAWWVHEKMGLFINFWYFWPRLYSLKFTQLVVLFPIFILIWTKYSGTFRAIWRRVSERTCSDLGVKGLIWATVYETLFVWIYKKGWPSKN